MSLVAPIAVALLAQLPVPPDTPSQRVVAALTEADEARQTEAAEAADWKRDQAKLELLIATNHQLIDAEQRRLAELESQLSQAQGRLPEAPQAVLQAVATLAGACAERINDQLDRLARFNPPGVIDARKKDARSEEAELDHALHRLERAERAAASVEVRIITGELRGKPRSVEMVRVGGVAGWWRSLDGSEAGEIEVKEGKLILHLSPDPDLSEQIAIGLSIAKGKRASELVYLPLQYARSLEEDQDP